MDVAYSHFRSEPTGTPYREHCTFEAFGPVANGAQVLYGLDYRAAMWAGDEQEPFHMEVGYWLWDPESLEMVRAFVVPRGVAVVAGGAVAPDATTFTLTARHDDPAYRVAQGRFLARNASTVSYTVTITIEDQSWSYDQTTLVKLAERDEAFTHTDRNILTRAA